MAILRFQPSLPLISPKTTFKGQSILITGATSGIGLECARELLRRNVSTLYLPVRSVEKGELIRKQLLSDATVNATNPDANIELFELDLANYDSVLSFSQTFNAKVNKLDAAILNAGTGTFKFGLLPEKPHNEVTLQVNFLSNALLSLLLLPMLEKGTNASGHASHLLMIASIGGHKTSWEKQPFKFPQPNTVTTLNIPGRYGGFERYGMSKMFLQMWTRELASRVPGDKVIVNSVCPGLTISNIDSGLPWYAQHLVSGFRKLVGRSASEGASTYIGAVTARKETNGAFYSNGVATEPSSFQRSPEGTDMQRRVWIESIDLFKQKYPELHVPGN